MTRILTLMIAALVVDSGLRAVRADEASALPIPQAVNVQPGGIQLVSSHARQRVLVSGLFADGTESDLTPNATFQSSDAGVVEVSDDGLLEPRGDGRAMITVRVGDLLVYESVDVRDFSKERPVDFRTQVIGAFSRGGCNQGACHGSPKGKNGFRLSLRGFDPDVDFHQLTRDSFGRRVNIEDPDSSLILLKASGGVAHQGGIRFRADEAAYQTLAKWVAEGCRDSGQRQLERLEVLPEQRVLHTRFPRQQIVVRAHYADGSVEDVTDLASFSTADNAPATVTRDGLVEFQETSDVAILVRFLDRIETSRLTWIRRDPNYVSPKTPENNFVDAHVFAKQRSLQLVPAGLAGDAVFLRRVHLDLIGALPTPLEARTFLDSQDADKRAKLIDRLLEREEYAEFWAMKWADVMRGNRETISERGVHNFHRYLAGLFRDDHPFDETAREIVTSLGNTIHEPAANFFRVSRTPNEAAESFSQLFLGVRIQCAKCHNHPYESITQNDYYGLSAYFSRVRIKGTRFGRDDEIVLLSRSGEIQFPGTETDVEPVAFGTPAGAVSEKEDRRSRLADWLIRAKNRYFARSVMNRVWFHLFGLGIVDPVDDFRDSNLPSNPALLDTLAESFIQNGFHFKPIMRAILNSRTYQLSAEATEEQSVHAANPNRYFTKAIVRMLDAEQILDAISSATGIAERFPGYPLGTRAISLAEGNIDHRFLQAFTRPIRDVSCECARETDPSMSQVVHLMNNSGLLAKIDSPDSRLGKWSASGKSGREIVELLYLATLSRRPTEKEFTLAGDYVASSDDYLEGLRDLQHALVMSNEFLLRH